MKFSSLSLWIAAYGLSIPLHAQSQFLDSLKQLQDQRSKALMAAAEPINRGYVASVEQLLERASKAKDFDSVTKINEELKAFKLDLASSSKATTAAKSAISLLDLPPKESKVGAGELVLGGTSFIGNSVLVDGQPCTRWLGAHAPSRLVYAVPPGINTFTAIGVHPKGTTNRGDWRYIIKIDGKEAFRSNSLKSYQQNQLKMRVTIPVASKEIELIVDEIKDYIGDHAIWALPTFQ